MVQYQKPSYRTRTKLTHRFLYYLHKKTSSKVPGWRDATLRFFYELFELMEKNQSINVIIHRDDGMYIYAGAKPVVYMHFRQKHFLAMTNEKYVLWRKGDTFFGARQKGSWPRMWRISTSEQVDLFLEFLKSIPKASLPVSGKASRTIPAWVQEFVYERDGGVCVACNSKENLCFDHIVPYSKGGASDHPDNIQLLCSTHNGEKSASFKY
jgi:hypothetical protein